MLLLTLLIEAQGLKNMPKNYIVQDVKPRKSVVQDVKPSTNLVLDVKSKNKSVGEETKTYFDTKTISIGQPMGLLLSLTYPSTFSFQAERS